jgi:hypothetical protein
VLKKNSPGCACCETCDNCTVIDSYFVEANWIKENGDWSFSSGSPPITVSTDDDDSLLSRENTSSEYRFFQTRFQWLSGTKDDASFYLGMRTADGDTVRVEVSAVKTTGVATCNVYKVESGSETLIDGPQQFTDTTFPDGGVDCGITLQYDPDNGIVSWCVSGNGGAFISRVYGTVACDLALRDLIIGTVSINGQTILVGKWHYTSDPGLRHSLCTCSDVAALKHAPLEFALTLSGLAATSTKMTRGPDGYDFTYKWLAEWAPDYNATYSLPFETYYEWSYNYFLVSSVDTKLVDVDVWTGGAFHHTNTDTEHSVTIQIYMRAFCAGNTTTIDVLITISDQHPGQWSPLPGIFPYIDWIDDWIWDDTYAETSSGTIKFQKTYSGAKDLRTLVDEELPMVAGTGSDYLDWSSVSLKLTAVLP